MDEKKYKEALFQEYPSNHPPEIGEMHEGYVFHNPSEETGNRKAFGDVPWIDFWQYLTGKDFNHLQCTFCGEHIFRDINSTQCRTYVNGKSSMRKNNDRDDYLAVGGHYYKNGKNNVEGYIIVPVCKDCNGKQPDTDLIVKVENKYVEEIGASVEKE